METVDRKEGSYVLFDPNDMRRTLNTFISKRTMLLLYFKNFYEDEAYYFNTLEFNTQAIMLYIQENEKLKRRISSWAQLGYSIGDLLAVPNVAEFTKALNVLVSEFEHDKNESTSQKMKQLLKKNKKENNSLNATNITFNEMPNTPFDFDFLQTFFALCDVTAEAYKKILQIDEKYLTKGYFDIVTRIDTNIKKIISSIIKEIDFSVRQILAQEFNIVIRCLIEE
ncbi:hypothetical protein H8356DRAFT_1632706 [Neocallimastix lanati (nom. inval.)]|jgi:hypothetical protein|uniref:Uncharacterized protein n=1 Tax=Neocallimastix californiae TaxID=1754190 RepID=A0A1Y2BRE6_9FUNG|nr:hypothetical protein H8356DRAFT_1632706 [Neocallimastix sp. JGI-2020a]ORY37303.1 hypothetical protein LY90DRAFT_672829 [Neocallimastix californiae]|eukprot:ORY37303.1 hypothetical protein LY90DRAFT_672829 [Neocallimastix californiae]